jgi:atypical dual specificity phosphatase
METAAGRRGLATAAVAGALSAYALFRWTKGARGRRADEPWVLALRDIVESRPPVRRVDLPVEILPHMLLGDQQCASDLALLQAFGVTHVLCAAGRIAQSRADLAAAGISSLTLQAEDEEGYPMLERHLSDASAFIRSAEAAGGRCLVHCVAGINRSGVLVTAELMLHERLPVVDAVHRVLAARKVVLWNASFREQLVALARREGLLGTQPPPSERGPATVRKPARKAAAALAGLI